MYELNGASFLKTVLQIQVIEDVLSHRESDPEWKAQIEPESVGNVIQHLNELEAPLVALQATLSLMSLNRARQALSQGMTWEALGRGLKEVKDRLKDELSLVRVFVLEPRMAHYLHVGEDLVGPEINTHFPSAIFDLEEAAKCLAVLRPTASAFHSMRALEVAIKALARFLDIPDPLEPSKRNWNLVLKSIKDAIEIKYPKALMRGPHSEGARIEGIYANLDAVRNPWRNATMHNENSYYLNEAEHILKCVDMLFSKLVAICDEQGSPV